MSKQTHRIGMANRLGELIEASFGLRLPAGDEGRTFVELRLEPLLLTQLALKIRKDLGTEISVRQLTDDLGSLGALAEHLADLLPGEPVHVEGEISGGNGAQPPGPAAPLAAAEAAALLSGAAGAQVGPSRNGDGVQALVAQQPGKFMRLGDAR